MFSIENFLNATIGQFGLIMSKVKTSSAVIPS